MPTASAQGFITNTGNTPTTYRARLVVQRFTPLMANYLDPIIGPWSSTSPSLGPLQASSVFVVPSVAFDLLAEYFAQARVQVSAVQPPNDLAGFSPWLPEPPYRAGGIVSGAWSGGATIASVRGGRVQGEFRVRITDVELPGKPWLWVAGAVGVGAVVLWLLKRRGAPRGSTSGRR